MKTEKYPRYEYKDVELDEVLDAYAKEYRPTNKDESIISWKSMIDPFQQVVLFTLFTTKDNYQSKTESRIDVSLNCVMTWYADEKFGKFGFVECDWGDGLVCMDRKFFVDPVAKKVAFRFLVAEKKP